MKYVYTKNTKEIRNYLETKGFKGLSFFQGGDFIYPFLTTRANKNGEWKEKDYATFSEKEKERMTYLDDNCSSIEDFKAFVENLK